MRVGFRFSLLCAASLFLTQMPAFAYQLNASTYQITVQPGATPVATTADIQSAFNYLINRTDPTDQWTLLFGPGQYALSQQVTINGLKNTIIKSSSLASPAQFSKATTWNPDTSGEYLLYFRFCHQLQLLGCQFFGQTVIPQNANPNWPDQGVYFGSSNTVTVYGNLFQNFGDAALRVVTDQRDPIPGVDSFITDVGNNTFNNIYQTATTATDNIHGGTAQSNWHNNTFTNVQGSIKFASRTIGANNITFQNNVINGGPHYGLEIDNYDNFTITGNTISNIAQYAMTIYTNGSADTMSAGGFPWGSNFTITNNTIQNVGDGILYNHPPFFDGTQNIPVNVNISNNTISTVSETLGYVPAIQIAGGVVNGLNISNNQLSGINNLNYMSILKGCSNVTMSGNSVNGSVFAYTYNPVAVTSLTSKVLSTLITTPLIPTSVTVPTTVTPPKSSTTIPTVTPPSSSSSTTPKTTLSSS